MFLKKLIEERRERKRAQKEALEYNRMLLSVHHMCHLPISKEKIAEHVVKATDEEVKSLITICRTIPKSEPTGKGYFIPSVNDYLAHSLESWPNRVYHLKKFEEAELPSVELSPRAKMIPVLILQKDLYVLYYNSFGFEETHLCGRAGYMIYDSDNKDIVYCLWDFIS